MFSKTITLNPETIKEYGPAGAIVLQVLFDEFGTEIPQDYELWEPLFPFMNIGTVKSTVTTLYKDNKLMIQDDIIYLIGKPKKQMSVFDITGEPEPEKKPREAGQEWLMATTLCKVLGFSEKMYNQKRYLRPAKKYLEAGYSIEFIDKRYSEGGDWYKYEFKGQKGSPPNLKDIDITLDKKYDTSTSGLFGTKSSEKGLFG